MLVCVAERTEILEPHIEDVNVLNEELSFVVAIYLTLFIYCYLLIYFILYCFVKINASLCILLLVALYEQARNSSDFGSNFTK